MAITGDPNFHRFDQFKSVDAVRWLPAVAAFERFLAAAVHDPDVVSSPASSLEIHSLTLARDLGKPHLHFCSSWTSPSRITALRTSRTPYKHVAAAAATLAGSLHILFIDPIEGSIDSELSIASDRSLHAGVVSAVDLHEGGRECVTVGEDGRVNLTSISEAKIEYRKIYDSQGLVSYTAAKWGSPAEFATGGLGFGIQWWDQRKPEGMVAQLRGDWSRGNVTGMVHSIDIHPSRKHICVVGGSSGTIFAWDLRNLQQPIILSGIGPTGTHQPVSESEVWEVQYDIQSRSSSATLASSSKVLPVMMCSEDGILAVLDQDEGPNELLVEPCAINSFDIDPQNPSDVVCGLEWESIGILMRP